MRHLKLAGLDQQSLTGTPLGECLIQLEQRTRNVALPTVREQDHTLPAGNWQQQWQDNRQKIAHRLSLIDAELNRLAGIDEDNSRLSVFPG